MNAAVWPTGPGTSETVERGTGTSVARIQSHHGMSIPRDCSGLRQICTLTWSMLLTRLITVCHGGSQSHRSDPQPRTLGWAPGKRERLKLHFPGGDIHAQNGHHWHKLTYGDALGSQSCCCVSPKGGNGDICLPRRVISFPSICCFSLWSDVFWSV